MSADQNKVEKRSKMLDAALSLFETAKLKPPSIDEVVKLAGVAKGTFYLYFKDKYDFLDQLFLRKFAECVNGAFEAVERQTDETALSDVEYLSIFLDEVLERLSQNRAFMPLMKDRIGVCYRMMLRDNEHSLKVNYDKLVNIFINHGYTRTQSEMHIYMLVTTIISVCCEVFKCPEPYSFEQLKGAMQQMTRKILT